MSTRWGDSLIAWLARWNQPTQRPPRPSAQQQRRARWLIAVGGLGTVAYSLAVLVSVATTGETGLRCVFGHRVVDVAPWIQWHASLAPDQVPAEFRVPRIAGDRYRSTPPAINDALLHIGQWPVHNYHDYVQIQRRISGRIGEPLEIRWQDAEGETAVGQVTIRRAPISTYFWSLIWFLQEIVVFVVGARVYWRRPFDESARIFFWLCVTTVGAFMGGYHWTQIVVHPPLIYLFVAFGVFLPILTLHFYLVFPRTNPYFSILRRPGLYVLYGIPIAAFAGISACMLWASFDPDASRVKGALDVLQWLSLGYIRLAAAMLMLCLVILVYSFRRARSRIERNQVRWILLATLLSLFPIAYLFWDTWNAPYRLGLAQSAWPMFIVSLFYTAAYAISITRYKLTRAEEYLNRGVVYLLVSVSAGLLYSSGLVILTLLIGDRLLADRSSLGPLLAGVTAILVLVLSESARHGFQRVLDRRFFREKYKFDQAMRRMSQAVESLVDRPTLARRLLVAAVDVLRVEWGSIYLDAPRNGWLELVAGHGPDPEETRLGPDNALVAHLRATPQTLRVPHGLAIAASAATDAMIALGGEVALPLEADGQLIGILVLGPKCSGTPYEDEELTFLDAMGSMATLAMRSAAIQETLEGLNQDLRDKVEKIAEQRRRILLLQDELTRQASSLTEEGGSTTLAGEGSTVAPGEPDPFENIKGSSPIVRRMVEVARKVAASSSAVLIRGESGTGKELLAEALHRASSRGSRQFVKVHCAALSQSLLESELFGHVKGAFTGADRDRVGRFQQADGGTLFLDEIGDINWDVQTKLLRVLQEMSFERVGSSQTITADVRIVAATHQDLERLIETGQFREDLYYRLNVISLRTPALRERKEDLFELVLHFLKRHAERAGVPAVPIDDQAYEILEAYHWPGNIRELENVIERAVVLVDGPLITVDDLPAEIRRPARRRTVRRVVEPARERAARGPAWRLPQDRPSDADAPFADDMAGLDPEFVAYERQRLLDALRDCHGNKSQAARLLALPRSTFFSKLKKHGLA